jgi:amidohydrolase
MADSSLDEEFDAFLLQHEANLIDFRRDLHAHPEIGYQEYRTTGSIVRRLEAAGLQPTILPKGTGVIVDIGGGEEPAVALRADIDALPIADDKNVPYRSLTRNACHACGHDVHTAILVGAGLLLARLDSAGLLPGRVRLIFQPAEEMSGGALDVLAAGGLSGVSRIFALHCDPKVDVGRVAIRVGPITAGCDRITIKLSGPGGHTARPHLTVDLIDALGKIVTDVPAVLARRVDPRIGVSLVWGRVNAGSSANAIPASGIIEGTLRCLDDDGFLTAPDILKELIEATAYTYGIGAELIHERVAPATVNDADSTAVFQAAVEQALGRGVVDSTKQSLGGEDFAWYLESVPGCLARLGTRSPGSAEDMDIHQSRFNVDERAIGVGVRVMTATALKALERNAAGITAAAGNR